MRLLIHIVMVALLVCAPAGAAMAQEGESDANATTRTMRPVIRGQHFAVASMKAEATRAAERVLEKGGNAFDAIVAGQAVLGIVDQAMNGIGADATLLVYDAKTKKVYSIDAEGTAPKLATIEWYKEHNGGKLPVNDSLLSATVPGCIDAWYILLDRWGTMSFAQVLAEAIDLAENGFPVGDSLARAFTTQAANRKLHKYPSSMKLYYANDRAPQADTNQPRADCVNTRSESALPSLSPVNTAKASAASSSRPRTGSPISLMSMWPTSWTVAKITLPATNSICSRTCCSGTPLNRGERANSRTASLNLASRSALGDVGAVAVWAPSGPEPSRTTDALARRNLVALEAVAA